MSAAKKKTKTWVFTVTHAVQLPAEQDEAMARAALARQLARTPNDASQQAQLRETREQGDGFNG